MDFFSGATATDKTYLLLQAADWEPAAHARQHVEALLEATAPYLDEELPQKAALALHPHYWEMLVAASLLEAGFDLRSRRDRPGPTDVDLGGWGGLTLIVLFTFEKARLVDKNTVAR